MQTNEVRETPSGGGTVLVSGATGGIGTALVEALIRKGRPVVALGRDAGRLAELSDEHPLVRPLRADLRHPESLAESVADHPELAELDAFVHCAGVSPVASVAESPVELWREVLAVNLLSAAELTRLLLPALRASRGHVVLVNASPGLHAVPRWSAFAASRASSVAGSASVPSDRRTSTARLALVPEARGLYRALNEASLAVCVSGSGPTLLAFERDGREAPDPGDGWRVLRVPVRAEGIEIVERNDVSAVPVIDDVSGARNIRGDDGKSREAGLDEHARHPLPTGHAREDEDVLIDQDPRDVVAASHHLDG